MLWNQKNSERVMTLSTEIPGHSRFQSRSDSLISLAMCHVSAMSGTAIIRLLIGLSVMESILLMVASTVFALFVVLAGDVDWQYFFKALLTSRAENLDDNELIKTI